MQKISIPVSTEKRSSKAKPFRRAKRIWSLSAKKTKSSYTQESWRIGEMKNILPPVRFAL
jgi:hypothetical protein